jgi:hypothetical protein
LQRNGIVLAKRNDSWPMTSRMSISAGGSQLFDHLADRGAALAGLKGGEQGGPMAAETRHSSYAPGSAS